MHTCHSDGTDTPARVVERAVAAGFSAMAITDHDTLEGILEGAAAAHRLGIAFLAGTELSSVFDREEVHILGLGVRLDCAALNEAQTRLREARVTRATEMVKRLNAIGVPVDEAGVAKRAGNAAPGRLHIAQEIKALGLVRTVQHAFDTYIGRGRDAFVPKLLLPAEEAVELIHQAGGLAFVAHPGLGSLHKRKRGLFELPFDGLEAYHTEHTPGEITVFLEMAKERNWLVTGGSDDHGTAKKKVPDMSKVRVPYRYYEAIQAALVTH